MGSLVSAANVYCAPLPSGPWRLPEYRPLYAACCVLPAALSALQVGPDRATCVSLGSRWGFLSSAGGWPGKAGRDRCQVCSPPRFTAPTGCPLLQATCFPGLWLEPRVAMASYVCWTRVPPFPVFDRIILPTPLKVALLLKMFFVSCPDSDGDRLYITF